jgi:hypothetical protein
VSDSAKPFSVSSRWTILRAGSPDSGGLEIPSLPLSVVTAAGPIRLAVGPSGEARLLLPLSARDDAVGTDAGDALEVRVSSFLQGGRAHRFLDLTCLRVELEPVFSDVVDEIVARVSRGAGCVDAARTTLDDFRALLIPRHSDRIERSRVVGLVAELVVLNRLLDVSPLAWRAWKGPTGDRHDFRAADTSLEAKASLRAGASIITVNGLEQMEPPSGGTLHLAHFILEPISGGLLTVSTLGRRALALADDPSRLRDILAIVGCTDVDDEPWNRDTFRVERETLYRVDGDFPRLVPSLFAEGVPPAGVGEVTYRVDLSVAGGFHCSEAEFDRLLTILAG